MGYPRQPSDPHVDQRLKQRFYAWFVAHPRRLKPVVIAVATAADRVVAGATGSLCSLPEPANSAIASGRRIIAGLQPLLVSIGPAPWNLNIVRDALCSALEEAQRVQRKRRRLEGAGQGNRLHTQVGPGVPGVTEGMKLIGGRLSESLRGKKGD